MEKKIQRLSNLDEQDEQRAIAKQHPSPYDQVKTEIQNFKAWSSGAKAVWQNFEKPFRCNISAKDWLKLEKDLNLGENEDRYPQFSYDTSTSTLIIEFMSTPVHEAIIKFLQRYIYRVSDLDTTRNEGMYQFAGAYKGSEGAPDLGIFERNGINESLKWVLEVGFSETYEHVNEKIGFWLKGKPEVARAVLVNITEDPEYKCPLKFISDEVYRQLGFPQTEMEMNAAEFTFDKEYGPISYKGFHWVGEITEIYWEVWKLDQGVPTQVGVREFILPATDSPQVRFDEFLSNPLGEPQRLIDWDEFPTNLKRAMRRMAINRFCDWKHKLAKNAGDDRMIDPDYDPPSLSESKDN